MTTAALCHAPRKVRLGLPLDEGTGPASDLASTAERHRQTTR